VIISPQPPMNVAFRADSALPDLRGAVPIRSAGCGTSSWTLQDLLDPAIPADWDEPQPCSCLPTAIGHALLIVVLGPGQLRPRQILHATDKLRTVAKARANLGVAGTSLPPGENPTFQRPEHLRIARRTRLTMRPRTKGQDLGHTPSASPESPGHLGRVNTSRYEPAYPPLDRPQVCVAGYYLRFHHYSTISRTTPTQFVSSKRLGEFGRNGPDSAREGHCVEVRAGRAAGPPGRPYWVIPLASDIGANQVIRADLPRATIGYR
jgi:hypothetical protein